MTPTAWWRVPMQTVVGGLPTDAAAQYRIHRAMLQQFQYARPRKHWVLKGFHGFRLAELFDAYPDATLVGHVTGSGVLPGRDVWAVADGDRMLAFEVTTDEPSTASWLVVDPGIVAAIVASQGTTYPDGAVAMGLTCS